jgi:hypothetical protein
LENRDADPVCLDAWPCDPAVVSADVGGQPGSVKAARLRTFALVIRCQGAFENEKMSELPNVELAGQEVGGCYRWHRWLGQRHRSAVCLAPAFGLGHPLVHQALDLPG